MRIVSHIVSHGQSTEENKKSQDLLGIPSLKCLVAKAAERHDRRVREEEDGGDGPHAEVVDAEVGADLRQRRPVDLPRSLQKEVGDPQKPERNPPVVDTFHRHAESIAKSKRLASQHFSDFFAILSASCLKPNAFSWLSA